MSTKSDNDNRSNQLNPNNPEYSNCRGGSSNGYAAEDDDDAPAPYAARWLRSASPHNGPRTETTQYYFAATTFDGTAVYVKFTTQVDRRSLVHVSSGILADAAKAALLGFMRRKCSLGVAYWRLATNDNRGKFYWYSPELSFHDSNEHEKILKWNTSVREQSRQLDLAFDWGKHDTAANLGVIKDETITFAPESDDLLNWTKQHSV